MDDSKIGEFLDELFKQVDQDIKSRDLDIINGICFFFHPDILIGFLTATFPIKDKMPLRKYMINAAKAMNLSVEGLE